MEKYTAPLTLGKLIENNVDIWNFNFSLYSDDIKEDFKRQFEDYFYYDEIGLETAARFKHRLKSKIQTIAPYYEKIILSLEMEQRILDNYDVTEEYEKKLESEGTSQGSLSSSTNTEETNKNAYSSRPMTKSSLSELGYLDNITEMTDSRDNITSSTNTGISSSSSTETYKYRKYGNIGIQTDADAVVKYWSSLRKIFLEIFEECKDLFMLIY